MNNRLRRLAFELERKFNFITHGHILNPIWNPSNERRRVRHMAKRTSMLRYLDLYEREIRVMRPAPVKNAAEEPERVFSIWFQGEENAPELVKSCFRSMRRNIDLELVVLDEKTIFDWISLPAHVVGKWRKGIISHAHFSDMCRIELLYQHGGIWCDATDFVTSPVPKFIMDADIFLFLAGETVYGWYSFIQNCFIRGRKGNQLLGIWRDAIFEFWKEENDKIDYFVHQLLFLKTVKCNKTAAALFEKMPKAVQDPTHALWYEHRNDAYDKDLFVSLTKDTFFQKTRFKANDIESIAKGTIADYIINS